MEFESTSISSDQSNQSETYGSKNRKNMIFTNNVVIQINELKFLRGDRNTFIDMLIIKNLKNKFGNKCLKEGYLFEDSIKIIERSLGTIDPEYFTGHLKFQVRFKADVCYPIKGQKIVCTVESTNKLGIKAIHEPLHIILARQHHIDKTEFDKIKIGDKIRINILGSRFSLYDRQIDVIALLDKFVGIDSDAPVKTHSSENYRDMGIVREDDETYDATDEVF